VHENAGSAVGAKPDQAALAGLVQGGNRLRRLLARQFGDDLQLEFLAKHGAGRQQADRVFGQELQAPREERGRPA
jgi:hypothetical protein